jgi:hypothetical protein
MNEEEEMDEEIKRLVIDNSSKINELTGVVREFLGGAREFKAQISGRVTNIETLFAERKKNVFTVIALLVSAGALLLNFLVKLF